MPGTTSLNRGTGRFDDTSMGRFLLSRLKVLALARSTICRSCCFVMPPCCRIRSSCSNGMFSPSSWVTAIAMCMFALSRPFQDHFVIDTIDKAQSSDWCTKLTFPRQAFLSVASLLSSLSDAPLEGSSDFELSKAEEESFLMSGAVVEIASLRNDHKASVANAQLVKKVSSRQIGRQLCCKTLARC